MTIGVVVTILWFSLGGSAAIDYTRAALRDPAQAAEHIRSDHRWADAFDRPLRAVANGVCVFRQGDVCDYDKSESRVVAGQTALTILALVTVFFGFWKQLFASAAKAVRSLGARHVIIVGGDSEAEALARAVTARKKPWKRRAAILIRREASQADIENLGSAGIALIVGDPTDKSVLLSCGAKSAHRIVAMGKSEAENVAVAAALADTKGVEQGDIFLRLESADLRRDLPQQREFSAADTFSLSEIAARQLTQNAPLFDDVSKRPGATSVHLAIIGWDEYALAAAERVLRMMWAPQMGAPKISVFSAEPEKAEAEFSGRFGNALEREQVWTADIVFASYAWRQEQDPWAPIRNLEGARGPVTSLIVSYPDDQTTLHCAAVLAGSMAADHPGIYVRDDANGTIRAVLRAYSQKRVSPFAEHSELLSPHALVDRDLDAAARHVHENYVVSCVLRQNDDAYADALRHGRGMRTRVMRFFKRAPNLTETGPALTAALEADFNQKFGPEALARLRDRFAEAAILDEKFTPETDGQKLWEDLSAAYVDTNRAAADHATLKLEFLGWRPASKRKRGILPKIAPAEISDAVAEVEHLRWCADKILSGWRLGPRDDAKRAHPDLIHYADFDEPSRRRAIDKDIGNWVSAPRTAAWAHPFGFERDDA